MGARRSEIHSLHATSFEYDEELEITLEKASEMIVKAVKISDEENKMIECLNRA